MALALELGEKSLAAEKLDQRLLALGDDDARVQRRAVAGIGDREGEPAGLSRSWKSRTWSVPARTLTDVGSLRE